MKWGYVGSTKEGLADALLLLLLLVTLLLLLVLVVVSSAFESGLACYKELEQQALSTIIKSMNGRVKDSHSRLCGVMCFAVSLHHQRCILVQLEVCYW